MEGGAVVLHITPWDQAALQLLANGTAVDEIAGCLGMGEREVDTYLTALFVKMGAASRSEAVAAAFRRGLLARTPDFFSGVHAPVTEIG
jgi:NarL family two-component system response regulator YdfI